MSEIHLVRAGLRMSRLFELARRVGLSMRDVDLGYLVHTQLGTLFGEFAPHPFIVEEITRGTAAGLGDVIPVLGYARVTADALRAQAKAFADPRAWEACDMESLASKPMPRFSSGTRLGFSVRIVPVVRSSKATEGHGVEIDAFLHAVLAVAKNTRVDRLEVYRGWLARELARGGAAELATVRVVRFQRARLTRRMHTDGGPRTIRSTERPDATCEGTLVVRHSDAFSVLLARGVGRHRAFGFGALLLRPV